MRFVLLMLAALTGAAMTATSTVAAPEADECLAKPKGVAPSGKHWYYNTDRKLQRKCWYLADAGGKIVAPARKQADTTPSADEPRETAQQPQPQPQPVDARAEFVEGLRNEQPPIATPSPAPSVQPQIQPSPEVSEPAPKPDWSVASRWPEPSDTFASSPAPVTVASAAVAQNEKPAFAAAPSPPAPAPAQQPPVVADSGIDMDFGLIAGGLILLVVVGGTIVIVSRRNSSGQDRLLRRASDRDDMGWPSRMAPRPAFPDRAAERISRSDVIEEVEQLLAARRQARESRAMP
jgi:hypothetical protein